jgi:hypothetical protein
MKLAPLPPVFPRDGEFMAALFRPRTDVVEGHAYGVARLLATRQALAAMVLALRNHGGSQYAPAERSFAIASFFHKSLG